MSIEEACAAILGKRAANDIKREMSVHWMVVAAMGAANTSHSRKAVETIRRWNAEHKAPVA